MKPETTTIGLTGTCRHQVDPTGSNLQEHSTSLRNLQKYIITLSENGQSHGKVDVRTGPYCRRILRAAHDGDLRPRTLQKCTRHARLRSGATGRLLCGGGGNRCDDTLD